MRFEACGESHPGRSRRRNEDFFLVDESAGLLLVADGMGGHRAGEVASQLAASTVQEFLHGGGEPAGGENTEPAAPASVELAARRLAGALEEAHRRLLAAAADGELAGMGTTAVALLAAGSVAALAHVGDSRAYRLRGGRLDQLTRDHTWVGEQVAAGRLTAEGARNHPWRNVITRALGCDGALEVEVRQIDLARGDLYLLCSDGLTGMLGDDDIRHYLVARRSLRAICRELVEAANARGGTDNITVVLARVEGE